MEKWVSVQNFQPPYLAEFGDTGATEGATNFGAYACPSQRMMNDLAQIDGGEGDEVDPVVREY